MTWALWAAVGLALWAAYLTWKVHHLQCRVRELLAAKQERSNSIPAVLAELQDLVSRN
jgi:hypothetical protein